MFLCTWFYFYHMISYLVFFSTSWYSKLNRFIIILFIHWVCGLVTPSLFPLFRLGTITASTILAHLDSWWKFQLLFLDIGGYYVYISIQWADLFLRLYWFGFYTPLNLICFMSFQICKIIRFRYGLTIMEVYMFYLNNDC